MTPYQLAVARQWAEAKPGASSLSDLVTDAIEFDLARPPEPRWGRPRPGARRRSRAGADARVDGTLGAASAQVIPLAVDETLRIEQIVDGQCVDLDVYEHDAPRRPFSAARTRAQHGIHPTVGAILWSAPPEIPLMEIVADSAPSHDLSFPACTPFEYEQLTGLPEHSSCSQLHALARRQFGLPDDPRADVLNLWLPSDIEPDGRLRSWPVWCRRGDYVELRARTAVSVVLSTCPDDMFGSSQYEPGSVRVIVHGASRRARATKRVRAKPVGPPAEVTIEVPDRLRSHLDDVCARGWLGYERAVVARALLFRYLEAISPTGPAPARSSRPPS